MTAALTAPESHRSGRRAEDLACRWLRRHRLTIVERNYRCPRGEIDIIAREGDVLVFVEVRYRRNVSFVRSADTVGQKKIRCLLAAIDHYLQHHYTDPAQPWRLDALGIEGALEKPEYCWIKDYAS
ncbi:MAG: YraN family protein [Gammaproteobacteria bacterium]|nr:YraN family protein [Pseudomonadota bacterium]MCH9662934.1 YraN family protein [Gammaproteobacteria bacterium]